MVREARSGLSGFGCRPERHPSWQEPGDLGIADPAEESTALVLTLAEAARRPRS